MVVDRLPTRRGAVLIIGSTGFIGSFVTKACLRSTHPTYLLLRSDPLSPKNHNLKSFQDSGAIVVHGAIKDEKLMENMLRKLKIEIVISVVGGGCILDQLQLIRAMKSAGTVKRFLPSEFGHDVDRATPVEPGETMYQAKRTVRRAVEAACIPYTYICCNSIASWPYHDNTHPADLLPPLDCFYIYGDGTVKGYFTPPSLHRHPPLNYLTSAYFVSGFDIGDFTMKCVSDERAENKIVHFRPPENLLCMNDLALLWEKEIGRVLPRVTVSEQHLLTLAGEKREPESIVASLTHDIFINGCQTNFSLDKPFDADACSLFPGAPFRSVEKCFKEFAMKLPSLKVEESGIPLAITNNTEVKARAVPLPPTCA